jgi:hypothetical protein
LSRKLKIIEESNLIATKIGLNLVDKEFNYGRGIGRADNHCILNGWIVIFELEFSQRHPEMNVLKVWPYLIENVKTKIFLIHHITDSIKVSPNRIALSSFIANKIKEDLKERFHYFPIINEFDKKTESDLIKKLNTKGII